MKKLKNLIKEYLLICSCIECHCIHNKQGECLLVLEDLDNNRITEAKAGYVCQKRTIGQ